MKEQNIQARETIVCGEPVIVFSADGWRWYSDKAEIERDQKRREQQMKPTRFLRKDVTLGNL
jgi:IS4 transposase